jgi:hypothetical protein
MFDIPEIITVDLMRDWPKAVDLDMRDISVE